MSDVLLSSQVLLDRLGREEQQLKGLGLVNHAAGVRVAIVALLKEASAARDQQPNPPRAQGDDHA